MKQEHGCLFELQCESADSDIAASRTCRLLARVSAVERDDYWLAEINPLFRGQPFGLGARDISEVIIATRLSGQSLGYAHDRTIGVYVARITDPDVFATKTLRPDQIKLILWGDVRRMA
jgi:hypothetical protein